MKKLIFIIMLFLSFISNLKALEDDWTDEIMLNKSIKDTEMRYRFYKLSPLKSIYEKFNADYISEYDFNDYMYTDYSDWSESYPEPEVFREIEVKNEETVVNDNRYNYITIDSFAVTEDFRIKGIIIKDIATDKLIGYKIVNCSFADESEIVQIENNKISNFGPKINSQSVINIKFESYYDVSQTEIVIYYSSNSFLDKNFNIRFGNDSKKYIKYIKVNIEQNYINFAQLNVLPDNGYVCSENIVVTKYRYRDALFKRNTYEKEYAEGYYTELDNYIKDFETAKMFYKFDYEIKENEIKAEEQKCSISENISYVYDANTCEKPEDILKTSEEKTDLKNKVIKKTIYNYPLILGSITTLTGLILLALYSVLKKIVNKCHTK